MYTAAQASAESLLQLQDAAPLPVPTEATLAALPAVDNQKQEEDSNAIPVVDKKVEGRSDAGAISTVVLVALAGVIGIIIGRSTSANH